jgi:hypothetical protein
MPQWYKLWGLPTLSQRINDGDNAREHGQPLLPNQEPSGDVPNKVDTDFDEQSSRGGPTGFGSQFSDLLTETSRLYKLHKFYLLAVVFAFAVGLVVIKLVYGRTSTIGTSINTARDLSVILAYTFRLYFTKRQSCGTHASLLY